MQHLEIVNPWAFALLAVLLPVVVWAGLTSFDSMRRGRKALVLLARAFVVIAAVAGLASVRWWHAVPERRLCVLALLDVSHSVPATALDEATPKIEEMFAKADDRHAVGLVLFAGSAKVAIPPATKPPEPGAVRRAISAVRPKGADAPSPSTGTRPGASALDLASTHVERALDLAAAAFPPGFGRRIVLFSDGNATDGDALTRAGRCRASGIDVSTALLSHERAPFDLAVTSCRVPSQVQPGVGFDVAVEIAARAEGEAALALYRNGYLLEERKVAVSAGRRTETFRQRLDDPGLYFYRAQLSCRRTQASIENDAAFAFTRLRTAPKALILGEADLEARRLAAALREGRIACEFRTADGAPERLDELLGFDAVVLNNIRASSLNSAQQRLLRDYVELFGGALLVIGLDAVGGYAGSPIEEALPVVCGAERLDKVSTSVIVIGDTSRSLILADGDEGVTNAIASRPAIIRRTACQIVEGLGGRDTFGMIGFGSEQYAPHWVVRPQRVYDRAKIETAIEERLLTTPRFQDPDALAAVIDRMAAPGAPQPPPELARRIEALVDPLHLPHVQARALMPFVRDTLKATLQAINPDALAQAVERVLSPNAFLARSNAYRSILRAVSELKQRETAVKSIILLSDGYLEGDRDYERIAGQLAADGIRVTAIALKEADANRSLLDGVVQWGQGRSWQIDDPTAFTEQFRQEMESIGKPRVMEIPFRARKVADSPLVRGVDVALAPQLFGYVRTSPKLGAQNVLAVPPDFEPLLASWEYGAGRTAAFTSDAQERWASLWLRDWPQGYGRLWSSVVHALCERPADRRLVPQLDLSGQRVTLSADFLDEANGFLNGEPLTARFYPLGEEGYVFSRTSAEEVPMTQTAPGRYGCEYRAPGKGVYIARVAGARPRDVATAAFVVSLTAEEAALSADDAALKRWAAAGGGGFGASASAWMDLAGKTRESAVNVSLWAMVLAALVFTVDVVARRWPAFARFFARGKRAP